jgi:adenosylcobinamide kinase/adenosylcobinamide-phosphate guanylyltransferase
MGEIITVVGGNRSGKSEFAQQLAESMGGRRFYVATCAAALDGEMKRRIIKHQAIRSANLWAGTLEEQVDLAALFSKAEPAEIYLLDSLGMWVNNLLYHQPELTEDDIIATWQHLASVLTQKSCTVILVGDEVGGGIIAADPLTRRFADLNGRINQLAAASSQRVYLVTCGIPQQLK